GRQTAMMPLTSESVFRTVERVKSRCREATREPTGSEARRPVRPIFSWYKVVTKVPLAQRVPTGLNCESRTTGTYTKLRGHVSSDLCELPTVQSKCLREG